MNLLQLILLIWVFYIDASVAVICKNEKGECLGGNCNNALDCLNGVCEADGSCICSQCFSGPGCENYDDNNLPYFLKSRETIYIEPNHTGLVYEVIARDDDNYLSCSPTSIDSCPCGEMNYIITKMDGEKDVFTLDPTTGKLWLNEKATLTIEEEFYLVVGVTSKKIHNLRQEEKVQATITLHVVVKENKYDEDLLLKSEMSIVEREKSKYMEQSHDKYDELKSDEDPDDTLTREKRSAFGTTRGSSNFTFNILSNVVEPILPGQSVDMQLVIILPQLTTAMDLNVELFVMDAVSGITTFALCNVQIVSIGSAIQKNNSTPLKISDVSISMSTNPFFLTFYDRAVLNFGSILNAATTVGGPDYSDSSIYINFTATMVPNALFTNSSAIVTAGAEYDNQNYVYVSQASFNYSSTVTVSYPSNVTLNGPNTIPAFTSGQFDLQAIVTNPMDTVYVDIFTPLGINDVFSITSLKLVARGVNHVLCTQKLEDVKFYQSVTGNTNYRATMQLPILLSRLVYLPSLAANELSDLGNLITLSFNVFVYGAKAGDTITIGAGILIGTATIWTGMANVTVLPYAVLPARTTPTSVTAAPLDNRTATPAVYQFQSAAWAINFGFDETAASNALISCTATPGASSRICGVLYGPSGKYIGVFPDLTKYVVYKADGSATWSFNVNTSVIDSTITTRLAGQSVLVMEVTVSYQTTTISSASVVCNGNTVTLAATLGSAPVNDLNGSVVLLGDTNTWYYGSQAGMDIVLSLPGGGVGYSNMILETAGDFSVTGWGSRVCQAQVREIGRGVGCIAKTAGNINLAETLNQSLSSSPYNDSMQIEFGGVCGSYLSNPKINDSNVIFRVIYDIPKPQTVSGTKFNLSIGALLGNTLIWTGWLSYVPSTAVPAIDSTKPPLFSVIPPTVLTSAVLQPVLIKVYLKTQPGTVGNYKITVTSLTPAIAQICRIIIINIGRNYACLDQFPYGKSSNPSQTITIVHNAVWGLSAVLTLGTVRNFGTGSYYSTNLADENTIEIGVIARGVAVGTPGTMQIKYDDGTPSQIQTVPLTITAATAFSAPLTNLLMNATGLDGTMLFYDDVTKQIDINIYVPVGYNGPAYLQLSVANPLDVTVCFAAVVWAGENVPCTLPSLLTSNITVGPAGSALTTLDFGVICYVGMISNLSENVIQVRVGLMPNKALTSAAVTATLFENAAQASSLTITVTKGGVYVPGNLSISGLNLYAVNNATVVTVQPGWRIWVGIYFQIPPGMTIPGELSVMTLSEGGHAAATVHGFRWGSTQGKNIACVQPLDMYTYKLLQNSSMDSIPMVHPSQTDTLIANLKYLTNTGISYMQYNQQPMDDFGNVEADIWIADNDLVPNNGIISVSFALKIGQNIIVLTKNLTLIRTGTEVMVLNNSLFFTNPTYNSLSSFNPGDKLDFTAHVKHVVNASQIEAYNATVRILLPSYVSFANTSNPSITAGIGGDVYSSNISAIFSNNGYLDFDIGYLFFTDILELNFSCTVDPYAAMPNGLGLLNSTALLRLVCRAKTSTAPATYCGATKYANYLVNGAECFNNLNISTFTACQFLGSTAIDATVAPQFSGTATGWSPAVRNSSTWNHNIAIDFLKTARVTQLTFNAVAGKRGVGTYMLQYSYDGNVFINACPNILTANAGALPTLCRFQSRYARMNIITADSTDETLAIGVSFSWLGCYVGITVGTCTFPSTTLTNQINGWRHIAMDTVRNIVYFCDYSPKKKKMVCYSSPDGSTWNVLPSYIGSLAGFDAGTSKMYAWDTKKVALISSANGATWGLVDSIVKASLALVAPLPIPGMAKSTFTTVPAGSYTADFDGLLLAGAYKVKWNSCCT